MALKIPTKHYAVYIYYNFYNKIIHENIELWIISETIKSIFDKAAQNSLKQHTNCF